MNTQTKPYLDPETYVEGDEFVSDADFDADIQAALAEARQWEASDNAMRTTILTDDGRRVGPEMMTLAEMKAQADTLEAESESRLAYDAQEDVIRLRLQNAEVHHSETPERGLMLHYDAEGGLVRIDILRASCVVGTPVSEAA